MKAAVLTQTGAPDVLVIKDVERPSVQADEVLIRIYAIGLNPVDSYTRQNGYFGIFPAILGLDFAGVVEDVGAEVKSFEPGDRVVGLRPSPRDPGAYAQYTTAKETQLALIPDTISSEDAASLPVAALTAYQVLYHDMNIQPGQRILIHGGAGGVGIFAIQLAKLRDAFVYATSSPKNFSFLRKLGADEVIDYKDKDFSKATNLDAVLDTRGGDTQSNSLRLIKKGGIIVSVLPYPIRSPRIDDGEIKALNRNVIPSGKDLSEVLSLLKEAKLRTFIQQVLPFKDIRRAHELLDAKHVQGKLVLNQIQ